MIQVAITVMSKGMDSAMYRNRGETGRGPQLVADDVYAKGERREDCGEDEKAPSCTESVFANENIVQS